MVPAVSTSYPNANAPLQSVMIANFTSFACSGVASAPDVPIIAPTASSASGSRSFHLPTFI